VRLDIRRIGQIKNGDEAVGNRTKVTVVKNKIAPPFRKVEFDILFNRGIDELGELLDIGVERGALKRSGTWLSMGDTRLGQGRDRAREFLDQNPDVLAQVRQAVSSALGLGAPAGATGTDTTGASSGAAGAGDAAKAASATGGGSSPGKGSSPAVPDSGRGRIAVPTAAASTAAAENGAARADKSAPTRK
jgi:recombination protein RecA